MSRGTKETTALAERPTAGALATAAAVDTTDVRGKEGITREDLILPRIAVCQSMSPQRDEDDGKYIAGLKEGDLFNTLTEQNFSKGPLAFVVVRLDKHAMQFDEDRKIVDFEVPWDDRRNEFTSDESGNRVPPVSTRFYDYVIVLADSGEPALLSFSNTKIKVAKQLNSLMAFRPGAAWDGLYTLRTVAEKNDKGKFYNFKIVPAGPTPDALRQQAAAFYEQFKGRKVAVDVETVIADQASVDDADVPF